MAKCVDVANPILSVVEGVVAVIGCWEIVRGLNTGVMHFGTGDISIRTPRRTDPLGFWLYGLLNAATAAAMVYLIISTAVQR